MFQILKQLWADDTGAVIATELLFIVTIVGIGIIVGLGGLRDALVTEFTELGNALLALSQGFTISGTSGDSGSTDGSAAIDTPSLLSDPVSVPPLIPSIIDVLPG